MSSDGQMPTPYGPPRQAQIYGAGFAGHDLGVVPADPATLEQNASAAMSSEARAYIIGSAGTEATARANREAFDRRRIVPRMWRDVSHRSLAIDLFGRRLPHPLMLAPIGVQELAHAEGDLATARAAAASNVPMIVSNQAGIPLEAIATCLHGTPWWMQLYWGKSPDLVASLAQRAEAAGAEALVVTLDTPILGWRPRDLNLGHLPFLKAMGIAQYTSDPVFRTMLARPPEDDPLAAAQLFMAIYSNPALTWKDLGFLRERTRLPILVKGINHPDDAMLALDHGADGVIVSNHGGRQVDGAIAALDALPAVVSTIAGRAPVLFDSGVRSGADLFKALALGARAVCVGRPYIYGLALGGEAGVRAVLQNLLAELDLTLGLAGHANVADLAPIDLSA